MTLLERFHVSGEPRDAELSDLDRDGWNDVVVAIRDEDKVQAYRNQGGRLTLAAEIPVGVSPREIAPADFNGDGCMDFVIANRKSYDVSVLISCGADAVGFQALDGLYPTDGEIAGLELVDIDGDLVVDVVQLHRASGEFSVRLTGEGGLLSDAVFYETGPFPNAMVFADFDGDGAVDIVTANLGEGGDPGSMSFRFGDGEGRFGEELRTVLEEAGDGQLLGRPIALEAADFDGDGDADLAVSCHDGRLAFFRGAGNGSFVAGATVQPGEALGFLFAAEALLAGDYDQDGDQDLAAANFYGELAVLENQGDLAGQTSPPVRIATPPYLENPEQWYHVREIQAQDLNGDGDLDLVLGLDAGLAVFEGKEGTRFEAGLLDPGPGVRLPPVIEDARFAVNGFALGDYDGDGDDDLAVACFSDGCLTLLAKEDDGFFREAKRVKVPDAAFIATGDVDGDGLADLVGTGKTALWVARSGAAAQVASPSPVFARRQISGVVINELMPSNDRFAVGVPPEVLEPGKFPDWIEIYNGGVSPADLSGWRLELTDADDGEQKVFELAVPSLDPGARMVFICSTKNGSEPYRTNWKLPASGGGLRLIDHLGDVVDEVSYPELPADVALARYADGSPAWILTDMSSPGAQNIYAGPLAPKVSFRGIDPTSLRSSGNRVRFFARAKDDVGVAGVSVVWKRSDIPDTTWARVLLYDDGAHADGRAADGNYAGTIAEDLNEGAEIVFYLECEDVSGATAFEPPRPEGGDDAVVSTNDAFFHLAIGRPEPVQGLELSEVVAVNDVTWVAPDGSTPDYVEIRNGGSQTVALDGLLLTDEAFKTDFDGYHFPEGAELQPGEFLVIACDGNGGREGYAPFKIDSDREQVAVARRTDSGLAAVIDMVQVRKLGSDEALFRAGVGGEWWTGRPSFGRANVGEGQVLAKLRDHRLDLLTGGADGIRKVLESRGRLSGEWDFVEMKEGAGSELLFSVPLDQRERYFRIRQP